MLQKPSTSYKNMKYFTYCLKQNIPIFIIFGIYFIMTLGFHFSQYITSSSQGISSYYYAYSILSVFDTYIISIIALIAAILNFKFLTSRKMSDIYYSVPISKGGLFWCNYFSGLFSILIPHILLRSPLLAIIFKGDNTDLETYLGNIANLWKIFGSQTASLLLAYAVAVFFVVNFGKILDLCIYYISFRLLLPTVFRAVIGVLNNNIAGIVSSASFLTNTSQYYSILYGTATGIITYFWVYILLWVAISAAAFLLFRIRKSECCETVFAFSYFKVVISVTAAFILGIFVLFVFSGGKYDLRSLMVFSPVYFFGAIVAFLGTLVLSKRSFNILNKQLYFFAIPCVAFVVLISYLVSGGFGRAAYIPKIDQVESVSITRYIGESTNQYYDYYSDEDYVGKNIRFSQVLYQENNIIFTEKEAVKTVMEFHESLLDEFKKYSYNTLEVTTSEGYQYSNYHPTIIYKLKDGTTVERQYNYLPSGWQNDEFDAMITLKEPETSDLVALENYLLKNNIGDVECTYSSAFPLSEFVCKQNKIKIGKNDFIKLLKTIYQEEEYLYYSDDINTVKDYMEIKIVDEQFNASFGNLIRNGCLIIRDNHPKTIKLLKKLGFKEPEKSYEDLDFSDIYAELISVDSAEVNGLCVTDGFVIEGKSKSEIEGLRFGYIGDGFSVFVEEQVETILKSATSIHQDWGGYAVRFTMGDSKNSKIYFVSNDVLKDLQIDIY